MEVCQYLTIKLQIMIIEGEEKKDWWSSIKFLQYYGFVILISGSEMVFYLVEEFPNRN